MLPEKEALAFSDVDLNAKDEATRTAFHRAAESGLSGCVQ